MDPGHPVFRQLAALASPQLFLCRRPRDDKTERLRTAITVDEVRALKSFFQLSAADGGRRVAIVDAADELNGAAANALLKILEEPPARAVLLLVCHRPAALLPTLRSRCRELRLRPLGPEPPRRRARRRRRRPRPRRTPRRSPPSPAARSPPRTASSPATASPSTPRSSTLLATAPGLDRRRAIALAEAAAGRDAAPRYALTLDLVHLALGRLALAARGRRGGAGLAGRGRAPRPPRRHPGAGPALGRASCPRSPGAPPTPARSTLTPPR